MIKASQGKFAAIFILFFCTMQNVFCREAKDKNVALQDDKSTNKSTTVSSLRMIGLQTSIELPLADLAKRYGIFNTVGGTYYYRTTKNWIVGGRAIFMFGNQIKEPGLLSNVGIKIGGVIAKDGAVLPLRLYQRGYYLGVDAGKIFPVKKVNAESGIIWLSSAGFLQHKINIFDRDNSFAQVQGDYKKGYDRLTNGLFIDNALGFVYFGKKKSINAYLALRLNIAATQGRREWWYDVQTSGRDNRIDASTGLMLGWFLPIKKKKVEEIYY